MSEALIIVTIVGAIAILALVWFLTRKLGEDQIQEMLKKRSGGAKFSHTAEYVEGRSRVEVALTLTDTSLFYENADLQARLDLDRIDEVVYSGELVTGQTVHGRVLLLRSHGQTFEFVLSDEKANEMQAHLPAHRMDEPGEIHAV